MVAEFLCPSLTIGNRNQFVTLGCGMSMKCTPVRAREDTSAGHGGLQSVDGNCRMNSSLRASVFFTADRLLFLSTVA